MYKNYITSKLVTTFLSKNNRFYLYKKNNGSIFNPYDPIQKDIELFGILLLSKGNICFAEKIFKLLVFFYPSISNYWNLLGITYILQNKFSEAEEVLEISIYTNMDCNFNKFLFAISLFKQNEIILSKEILKDIFEYNNYNVINILKNNSLAFLKKLLKSKS